MSEVIYDLNTLVDGDDFSELAGKRRPSARKRRPSKRKAKPSVRKRMPSSSKRSVQSKKYISTENSEIGRLQRTRPQPKSRPTPKARTTPSGLPSQTKGQSKFGKYASKLTPVPTTNAKKQGGVASDEKTSSNKMLYVIGGIAALALIGFLIYKNK